MKVSTNLELNNDREKRLVKYYKHLVGEMLLAHAHFHLWKRLQDYRSQSLSELNWAPFFFYFSMRGHFEGTLFHIFRVLDADKKSLNIHKFLNYIEQNLKYGILSTEAFKLRMRGKVGNDWDKVIYEEQVNTHTPITISEVATDRAELQGLEAVSKLRIWRDKQFAHSDRRVLAQQVNLQEKYPVTAPELDSLIGLILDILNRYNNAYCSETYAKRWFSEDDIDQVMGALGLRIKMQKKLGELYRERKEVVQLSLLDLEELLR